jgi:hypothetical protein
MSQPSCELCSRPVHDTAYVCPTCTKRTAEDLERIVDYAPEVEIAVLKLVRYGGSGGGSGERPVPFDAARAERAAAVGNTVGTWARHVAESRGVTIPAPSPMVGPLCRAGYGCRHWSCERIRTRRMESGAATAAAWLADRLAWLRHQPEAPLMFPDLRDAARELGRIVDRPRDLWYAGPCWQELDNGDRCQNELYAVPGTRTVKCRECGTEYDAEGRRDWLLAEAHDALVHAELMARALTALGVEDVTPARVRGMARHGRLMAKGVNQAGDPTYRVGDVLAVIEEQAAIEEGKRRGRAIKAARAEARRAEKAAAEAAAA